MVEVTTGEYIDYTRPYAFGAVVQAQTIEASLDNLVADLNSGAKTLAQFETVLQNNAWDCDPVPSPPGHPLKEMACRGETIAVSAPKWHAFDVHWSHRDPAAPGVYPCTVECGIRVVRRTAFPVACEGGGGEIVA